MPGSPIEMPGSPSSDCSASTASMDFISPPVSPYPSEDSCSSSSTSTWTRHARPLKSSLRRNCRATAGCPQGRRVTWHPATVFETAPLISKRRRAAAAAEELAQSVAEEAIAAPTPKRAKFADSQSDAQATFRPHIAPASSHFASSLHTLAPELADSVVPCYDFSSCLAITMTKQTFTPNFNTAPVIAEAKPITPAATPIVAFSITKSKAPVTSKLLSRA